MKKRLFAFLMTLLLLLPIGAGARADSDAPAWQAYNGKRLGVLVGPLMEGIASDCFPDSEVLILNSYPDCIAALLAGKIDAYIGDEAGIKAVHAEQPQIDYIHERITNEDYCFAFRKDDPESAALCEALNAFLAKCRADGTLQEIDEIWFGVDEARKLVDMSDLSGENGTIRVVTTAEDMPFSYIKDGKNVGYDIDLIVRFCREAGYALELDSVDFSACIPAVQSGKYDFSTDMNATAERREQVLFSDPTASGGVVLAVLNTEASPVETGTEEAAPLGALSRFSGKRIGVQTGTSFDAIVLSAIPDAEIVYVNSKADLVNALEAHKIDGYAVDEPVVKFTMQENNKITFFPEYLDPFEFGFVFRKDEAGMALRDQFDAFLQACLADGTMDEIEQRWFSLDDADKVLPDYTQLPATNGTLRFATEALYKPFSFILNNSIVGFDIELAIRFCEAYGYGLEITDMSFDGILPAVQSGKADFAGGGISITEERKESVSFSAPYYTGGTVVAILKDDTAAQEGGFWSGIASSFEKTFLRESRWQLFLRGIGNTLLITLLAILFGTLLGFLVFMLCRNGHPLANGFTRFSIWLVQGTPMVVLLMILYYIIFGSVAISGIAVAVIGFSLTFGSAVFGLLQMGVGTIDRGQYEAAYALGHSSRHTFFRIILPQAIPHILPAYQGEIVGLIKATAIVGYIAVQDLTKMGDIVRSRTYEAFFPLIAITMIYFVLEGLFSFLVGRLRIRFNPKKRSAEHILKGVSSHD